MTWSYLLRTLQLFPLWISTLWHPVHCQSYSYLPPDPYEESSDGTFTWPAGDTDVFSEGSTMTISWTTVYPMINLYNIFNLTYTKELQIVTGFTGKSVNWVVDCAGDCTEPFVLRAVNAANDSSEGFWSRQFWISPPPNGNITATTNAPATNAMSTSTTISANPSAVSSSSSSSKTENVATSTSSNTTTSIAIPSGQTKENTAIGAGVGVGVGAALLLIGGCALLLRHRHDKASVDEKSRLSTDAKKSSAWQQSSQPFLSRSPATVSEMMGSEARSPVEAPGWPGAPSELPSDSHSLKADHGQTR